VIALAALAGPAKPFIAGRMMTATEWTAWALAVGIAMALGNVIADRPRPFGFALAAVVLAAELAPYRFASAPAAFNWVPFRALIAADWYSAVLVAASKAFAYGALVYLLGSPAAFGRATLAVAGGLCALEWIQRWLPGRVPDITDPVMAIMLGAVIWVLPEPASRPNTLK
jgi:hypothetical protein